jgi:phosphoglycolate phosphatase
VFDFDGTLVESNAIKREAYYQVFASHPASRAVLDRILRENPGDDRYGIIRKTSEALFARRSAGKTDAAALPAPTELAAAYGHICEEHIALCAAVPGALEAITGLADHHPLYVDSATPEVALRRAVQRRGWAHLFRDLLGGPRTKVENLERVAARESLPPNAILLVGDGPPDLAAAREFGCPFVGFEAPARALARHPTLSVLAPLAAELYARPDA